MHTALNSMYPLTPQHFLKTQTGSSKKTPLLSQVKEGWKARGDSFHLIKSSSIQFNLGYKTLIKLQASTEKTRQHESGPSALMSLSHNLPCFSSCGFPELVPHFQTVGVTSYCRTGLQP